MRSPLLLFVVACLVRPASSALSIRPFSLHADTEPSSLEAFSGEEGPLGVRRLLLDMTGPDALATPPTAGLEGRKHIIIFSQVRLHISPTPIARHTVASVTYKSHTCRARRARCRCRGRWRAAWPTLRWWGRTGSSGRCSGSDTRPGATSHGPSCKA